MISVKNFAGFVSVNGDGSWICEEAKSRHRDTVDVHPDPVSSLFYRNKISISTDPFKLLSIVITFISLFDIYQVEQVKKQASILESYLEQRGLALPEGYVSYKVMIPNPKFRYALFLNFAALWY